MSAREHDAGSLAFALGGVAALAGAFDALNATPALTLREALVTLALWCAAALPGALALGMAERLAGERRRARAALRGLVLGGLAIGGLVLAIRRASGPLALIAAAGLVPVATALARRPAVLRTISFGVLLLALPATIVGSVLRHGESARHPAAPAARPADARAAASTPNAEEPRPPDVVLIVLDTQRADHLGPWATPGSVVAGLTPAFDELARESTVFLRAHSTASWTVPSHASLFTGLHPVSHGASWREHRWLDDEFVTLAEALRTRGYRTAALVSNHWLEAANLLQGFESVHALGARFRSLAIRPLLELLGAPARWMDHGASDAPDALARVIESGRTDTRPLFLFVNLLEPHWRHLPPFADRRATLPAGVGWWRSTRLSTQYYGPLLMAGKRVEGPLDSALRGLYAGAVRHQDRVLGDLLAAIDGALDPVHTLLVVTADHGENLGEGGRYDHVFALNDALVHVPLLLRFPGRLARGPVDDLVSLVDVPATLAAAIGDVALASDDGRSLLGGGSSGRTLVFAESDPWYGHLETMANQRGLQRDVGAFTRTLRMAFDGRYRCVSTEDGVSTLFDLDADPEETHDLSDVEPGRARALESALREFFDARPPYRTPDAAVRSHALDPAELERLRGLGYVQ